MKEKVKNQDDGTAENKRSAVNELVSLCISERNWFDLFERNKEDDGGMLSWCAGLKEKMPTSHINYHLSKLVKKGILTKEAKPGVCTIFRRAS